jgi:hypothetical protein
MEVLLQLILQPGNAPSGRILEAPFWRLIATE